MGTRGAIGFRLGKKDYIIYNHFDSYPAGLGRDMVYEFKSLSDEDFSQLKDRIAKITLIDGSQPPTPEQIEATRPYHNLSVSEQSTSDWYCLLREAQGTLTPYMMGQLTLMLDYKKFLANSLFCEYAYIFNLSKNVLEFYEGFNKNPDAPGRYASLSEDGKYYGVALVAEFPFAKLRDLPEEDIVNEMIRMVEDDN